MQRIDQISGATRWPRLTQCSARNATVTLAALIALIPSLAVGQSAPAPSLPAVAAPAAPVAPAPADAAAPTNVNANLNVSPKRVVFDRLNRSATVYVFNQGAGTATFDILLIDRVMLPDGQIAAASEVETKPELRPYIDRLKSAKAILQTSPRRATLGPGKGQTIRIRVAAPAGEVAGSAPPDGEYRTHLTIVTIPPRDIGLTAEQAASGNPGQLSFRINTVFGISIPVITRLGATSFKGEIKSPKIVKEMLSADGVSPPRSTGVLVFEIERLGPNSLFGNFEVRGAKEKGSGTPLGAARGVGVYPELERRQIKIPLTRIPPSGEQIEVIFKDDDTAPGQVIAKVLFKAE